jgi:hypothetical protein
MKHEEYVPVKASVKILLSNSLHAKSSLYLSHSTYQLEPSLAYKSPGDKLKGSLHIANLSTLHATSQIGSMLSAHRFANPAILYRSIECVCAKE